MAFLAVIDLDQRARMPSDFQRLCDDQCDGLTAVEHAVIEQRPEG